MEERRKTVHDAEVPCRQEHWADGRTKQEH